MKSHKPNDEELAGMTVNERLWACDLYDQWRQAALLRNRDEMIAILGQVCIPSEKAAYTVDSVLADPKKFGF